jgi:hypothetical protein
MINIVIGILIGGTAAMVFPEQAATGFEFFRDNINMIGQAVVEATE